MARPIAPTPKLDAKASRDFLERVQRDLKNKVGPVPTPKVDKAIKLVMADATDRKRCDMRSQS